MASDVALGVWCAVFGVLAVWCGVRYVRRGPLRRIGRARVLRVWEPEPGEGWTKGVPAEVAYVDPATGSERVGVTFAAGGGAAGELPVAWPGREVDVFARTRRPADFRVWDGGSHAPLDKYVFGFWTYLALVAVPVASRVGAGRPSVAPTLWSLGVTLLVVPIVIGAVVSTVEGRHRKRRLAASVTVTGRVIDVKKPRNPHDIISDEASVTPVVTFTTVDGHEVTAVMADATTQVRPGDDVTVRHVADDPSVCVLELPERRGPALRTRAVLESGKWVRADRTRVRADRITSVEIGDGHLLLRTADQESPVPLTPVPALTTRGLERLADALLAAIAEGEGNGSVPVLGDAAESVQASVERARTAQALPRGPGAEEDRVPQQHRGDV